MNVADLMVKDEFIVKTIELKGDSLVYATNKRLFIKRGAYIQDISYQHISSMSIKTTFVIPAIIGGAIIALMGIISLSGIIEVISEIVPEVLSWVLTIVGLILVVFGFIKTKVLNLTVVGMNVPVSLTGAGVKLEDLFIIARENHTTPPANEDTIEVNVL